MSVICRLVSHSISNHCDILITVRHYHIVNMVGIDSSIRLMCIHFVYCQSQKVILRIITEDYAIMGTAIYSATYQLYIMYGYIWKRPTNYENKYTTIECTNMECRHFGLSTFWFVDALVCRRFGLSTFWSAKVLVCRHFDLSTFWSVDVLFCRRFCLSTIWFVDVLVIDVSVVDVLTSYHY